jgi:hypothetical protein
MRELAHNEPIYVTITMRFLDSVDQVSQARRCDDPHLNHKAKQRKLGNVTTYKSDLQQ